MDISLDIYKTFYYVCELKNITKTAEVLCVTQPAVTKQIKKIEELLGKSLIVRTSKGIDLTNEGKIGLHKLRNGDLDLVLFTTDELTENYSDIVVKNLCEIQDIFVISSDVKKRYPKKISVLDLNNLPNICKRARRTPKKRELSLKALLFLSL